MGILTVPSSRVIDVALGMALVFGVTAALSSVITEVIARFLGLRGSYLLRGLRELVDGNAQVTTNLSFTMKDYEDAVSILAGRRTAAGTATRARAALHATPGDSELAAAASRAERAYQEVEKTVAGQRAEAAQGELTATGALLGGPILRSHGMAGQINTRGLTLQAASRPERPATLGGGTGDKLRRQRRSLPSYISAPSFAAAVVDMLVPDASGKATMSTIQESVNALPDSMSTLRSSLQALAKGSGDDLDTFRTSVERWYDDHMSRVSGWYKRHVSKITLLVGVVLVLLLNINAVTIGRTLYTDNDVRAAMSAVAVQNTACPTTQDQQTCLKKLEKQLSDASAAGLPIGWTTVRACGVRQSGCNWWDRRGVLSHSGGSGWQIMLVLIGFLLTVVALVPGARFWFDLLGSLGSLRTSGPKPAAPTP